MRTPLRIDPRPPALVGTVAWTVLLGAALARQRDLVADGREWWLWTCLAGVALGLVGLAWATWLEARRQRRSAGSEGASAPRGAEESAVSTESAVPPGSAGSASGSPAVSPGGAPVASTAPSDDP